MSQSLVTWKVDDKECLPSCRSRQRAAETLQQLRYVRSARLSRAWSDGVAQLIEQLVCSAQQDADQAHSDTLIKLRQILKKLVRRDSGNHLQTISHWGCSADRVGMAFIILVSIESESREGNHGIKVGWAGRLV